MSDDCIKKARTLDSVRELMIVNNPFS